MTKQDQRAKIEKLIEDHLKATDPLGSDPLFQVSPVVHPELAAGAGTPKGGAKKSAAKKPAAKKSAKASAKKGAKASAKKGAKAAPKRKQSASTIKGGDLQTVIERLEEEFADNAEALELLDEASRQRIMGFDNEASKYVEQVEKLPRGGKTPKKAAPKAAPKKAAPKQSAWMSALKEYNSDKERWCIPKKGTPQYDEVKALMPKPSAKKAAAKAAAKPAAKKAAAKPAAKAAPKAKSAAKRPLSEWQQFVKKNMKKGVTLKELSELYKKGRQDVPMSAAADGGTVIGGTVIGGVNDMFATEPNLPDYIAARGGFVRPSIENFQRPMISQTKQEPNRYTSVNNDTRSAITKLWDNKSYEIDYHV